MTKTDAERGQVAAEAAEVYEDFFVPALFAQWTGTVLDAAGAGAGDRVLDVGCGTGVLARAAAARVGPDGDVIGLDRNQGMLAVARRAPARVTWQHGVAEDLPFPDRSFDRVVSQFVLMFVDDRARVIDEVARVLAPGGTVAFATWAAVDESPGYAAMVDLLDRVVGADAADALRVPFCLGAASAVADVVAVRFPDVVVTRHEGVARFESIDAWLHTDIRGWTLAGMVDDTTYARLLAEARRVLRPFTDGAGAVSFPIPALVATAHAPG